MRDYDYKSLDEVASFIGQGLLKWKVPVSQYKEKWGTVRVYLSFGWHSIHDITHSGYAYTQYKRDSFLFNLNYNNNFNQIFRLVNLIVVPFHIMLYKYYYKKAARKWPHLKDEIINFSDYPELLK